MNTWQRAIPLSFKVKIRRRKSGYRNGKIMLLLATGIVALIGALLLPGTVVLAATAPNVAYTVPTTGDTLVGTNKAIAVTFDSDMNSSTINATTFMVKNASQQQVTAQSISYDTPSRTATFVLAAPLATNATYTVTVTTGVKNSTGIPMALNYTWSFTTGSSPYFNPHGNYISNITACKSCHQTHTASGKDLLKKSAQTLVCYTCHDGSGSSYNTKAAFNQTGPTQTYHPVKDTGNGTVSAVLECTDCHNPHGDKNGSNIYPRLLHASDGTSTSYQGNQFCLICHGAKNLNLTPTYYQNTAGDHTNNNAAHYDITKASLLPSSGTKITCVQCHDKHSGTYNDLLNQAEENVCYTCHNSTANSMSGRNIQAEFALSGSRHDITGATGAKLECTSCHGPHTAGGKKLSDNLAYSDLSDPSNTKKPFTTVTGTPNATVGTMTDFCLVCHGTATPVAGVSSTSLVPYTITFPGKSLTTNNGNNGNGWDKSTYKTSVHYAKNIGCEDCHAPHGSAYPNLEARAEDTDTVNGECLDCHSSTGTNPKKGTAPNVKTDLTQTGSPSPDRYRHPTLYISGQHSDTEDYSDLYTAGKRHAECIDCHDPHNEQKGTGVYSPPTAPPPLRNVSGVDVNYAGVTWNNWSAAKNWIFMKPITNQYQLCFKCHSSYAWQNNPPAPGGSIQQTDIPMELNPNNPSYHAVVGASKMPTFKDSNNVTHYYGKFNTANLDSTGNPWSATSRLYCEDCHRSGTSSIRGPHGSNYWYLLKAPWTPNTGAEGMGGTGGAGTSNHLCFICHDYNFYAAGADGGSDTVRSKFSTSGNHNLHKKHSERGCTSCHIMVTHGYKRQSLLVDTRDTAPYDAGAWAELQVQGVLDGTAPQAPETWRQDGSCNHGTLLYGPNKGKSCG